MALFHRYVSRLVSTNMHHHGLVPQITCYDAPSLNNTQISEAFLHRYVHPEAYYQGLSVSKGTSLCNRHIHSILLSGSTTYTFHYLHIFGPLEAHFTGIGATVIFILQRPNILRQHIIQGTRTFTIDLQGTFIFHSTRPAGYVSVTPPDRKRDIIIRSAPWFVYKARFHQCVRCERFLLSNTMYTCNAL